MTPSGIEPANLWIVAHIDFSTGIAQICAAEMWLDYAYPAPATFRTVIPFMHYLHFQEMVGEFVQCSFLNLFYPKKKRRFRLFLSH
jgi:hypothetical protein